MATETEQMDDAALFKNAVEAPAQTPAAETPVEPAGEGRPRDEHGRFAPKAEMPVASSEQPAESAQSPADHIPSWRLREESEARRAAEQRMAQYEMQARQLQDQLRKFTEKPPEPIDPFADPQRFRDDGIQQHVAPVQQEMLRQREYFSRELALTKHGEETVRQAYDWLEKKAQAGDPQAMQIFQQVMGTMDPYGSLISIHKRETVASDPENWMRQELMARAKDPAKRQELLQLLSGGEVAPGQSAPRNVVQLPPSLNRAGGSAAPNGGGSLDDASLFDFAMRQR
jgi:hypothetical protein